MTNFWDALEQVDQRQPEFKAEYRLYYNEQTGEPLFYTMEQPKGTFIWIGKDDYARNRFDIRIKNGKIAALKPGIGKLVPAEQGTETSKTDVSVIESGSKMHWQNKTYDELL